MSRMQLIDNFSQASLPGPSVVSVGSFDGIHIGHQHLLKKMRQVADRAGYSTVVVTFYPRPKVMLGIHPPDCYLSTPGERSRLLENLGVDLLAVIPFTPQFARTPADDFVQEMVNWLEMRQLWVGPGFALGRKREGDIPNLRQLGQAAGFELQVVDQLVWKGELVSSTRIRRLLSEGRIRESTFLLGRYPALVGKVEKGEQRGRRVGFPTANVAVPAGLAMPANGVYACFVWLGGHRWPAVTNVGMRPTFGGELRTVESYLLDFSGDLYDKELRVELVDYLRPEVHFDNLETLSDQIRVDVQRAASLLEQEDAARAVMQVF